MEFASDPIWQQLEGPDDGPLVIFTHGAGVGPQSEFMQAISHHLVAEGIGVFRFEFEYMSQVRIQQRKRPPSRQPKLQQELACVVSTIKQQQPNRSLWLMGKSMGARVAFQVADALDVEGCIGLGFPFHPAAKPDRTRTHELANQCAHNLVVQGERDALGHREFVATQSLPSNLYTHWVPAANHDLVPLKSSQITAQESWYLIALQVAHFIKDPEWRLSLYQ